MIENIKLYSTIAAKSFAKWLALVVTGVIFSLILFLIVFFQNNDYVGSFFGDFMANNLPGFILFVGTPVFVILYFVIANKYFTETAIFQIWKNKAEQFVGNQIKTIVDKILARNKTITSISDESILRVQLLDENRRAPGASKLKQTVLAYIIKKVRLDDIDFSDKDIKLSDIIATKVNNFISDYSEPTLKWFWIVFVVQTILFIISQFY